MCKGRALRHHVAARVASYTADDDMTVHCFAVLYDCLVCDVQSACHTMHVEQRGHCT